MTTHLQPRSAGSTSGLRRVKKQTVTDDVEGQLRDAILAGQLAPGESLAEAQLASQLGVSRASIRQAKFQLAQEGLLEFDSRGTAFVRALTEDDIREILEFREVLDVAAIRLACSRLTDEVVRSLEQRIEAIRQETDLLQLTHRDVDFHEVIIQAAGNSRLLSAWRLLRPQLVLLLAELHRQHMVIFQKTQTITAASHQELVQALQSGDIATCEELARRHAYGLKRSLDEARRSPPTQPAPPS
ncbi:GntR family transcriptional regulator [Bremerella sp. JC817]|uniref:GntR family transcriptional regulator n=1 Tax=Bremerella sp. JC817 TaxID=3231756 RepID=UPI003458908E